MKLNLQYDYPDLVRTTREDGVRHYTCPETGTELPSVTTILSHTADKKFLKEWRERVGEKEADRQSKYGTDLGSLMHEHVEKHILCQERPRGTAPMRVLSRNMADALIRNCLPKVNEIWGIETPLYYPGLYAGTTDLVGIYDGIPSVMDHKSAKKMRNREQIEDYRDQIAAYCIAHDAKYGTKIEQGVVFMVDRELNSQVFIWGRDEIEKGKTSFLNRVERYLDDNG